MRSHGLTPLEGVKNYVLLSLTNMEIFKEGKQDMIKLNSILGKLKNLSIKDHVILSKAFSRSIFWIMLAFFPFILDKVLMKSWIMMALYDTLLLKRKIA